MKTIDLPKILLAMLLLALAFITIQAHAQDYVSPTNPAKTGRSPGVRVRLISDSGATRTYIMIFSPGDEIVSGLNEFAQKYNVKSAHFKAIGDAVSAKIGWYDRDRKMFKVISISTPAEITSLIGDIAIYNGKPSVHAHINLATEDGIVHGGHLLEAFVGPTLEVSMTVEPKPMYKSLSEESKAAVIDPAKTQQ